MNKNGIEIFAERGIEWGPNIRFYMRQWVNGEPRNVTGFSTRKHEDCTVVRQSFELHPTEAQHLMDRLWHCGLRPSEGTGSAGALAATQEHLKDMRESHKLQQTIIHQLLEPKKG